MSQPPTVPRPRELDARPAPWSLRLMKAQGPDGPHLVSRRGRIRCYADIRIRTIMTHSILCKSIATWQLGGPLDPGRTAHNQIALKRSGD